MDLHSTIDFHDYYQSKLTFIKNEIIDIKLGIKKQQSAYTLKCLKQDYQESLELKEMLEYLIEISNLTIECESLIASATTIVKRYYNEISPYLKKSQFNFKDYTPSLNSKIESSAMIKKLFQTKEKLNIMLLNEQAKIIKDKDDLAYGWRIFKNIFLRYPDRFDKWFSDPISYEQTRLRFFEHGVSCYDEMNKLQIRIQKFLDIDIEKHVIMITDNEKIYDDLRIPSKPFKKLF